MEGVRSCLLLFLLVQIWSPGTRAMSLYDYYAPNGSVSSGLVAEGATFTLNGKQLTIISGSMHYFRVHPDHWRDTLRKLRAAGLNTVQTYVPWNLHEPRQGSFDFGDQSEPMSAFLDLKGFVQMAQEEDLFVLFRPGPYICAEWEFGGLPSWLLRDPSMRVRTAHDGFVEATRGFLQAVLAQVEDLRFTVGGPIIAVQLENELGNFGWADEPRDKHYLELIRRMVLTAGFSDTLLFTSDSPAKSLDWGALPGVLQTANFKKDADKNLDMLELLQPDRPVLVAEFWSGWFDHWLDPTGHNTWDVDDFASTLEYLLGVNASINLYMFIGGTNFGFMAGANALPVWPHYAPIVTSYDYDAPLSEAGDYTEKYNRLVEVLARYNPLHGIVDDPPAPVQREKKAYPSAPITHHLSFPSLLFQAPESFDIRGPPVNMEALPFNGDNGQSYGYVVYTAHTLLPPGNSSLLIRGHIRDMAQVLVDGVLVTRPLNALLDINDFGFWNGRDKSLSITGTGDVAKVDILVENLGRINYGAPHKFVQKKGLWEGDVLINREPIQDWIITPLEFRPQFVESLLGWQPFEGSLSSPAMYQAEVTISEPQDTFLDMRGWGKGVVFLNGFNLGRYWSVGPPRTLYVPAPLLKDGVNKVVVFEQYQAAKEITFIDKPILEE